MDFKLKYFLNRKTLQAENSVERSSWYAAREIQTFSRLLRLAKISRAFDWKKIEFLDLGAGDQFLKQQVIALGAKYKPIDYDEADFNEDKLPFQSDRFDLIFSLAVIEHLHSVDKYLSEVCRILKPGGVFYITTPNFRYSHKSFFDDPTHIKPFTEIGISKLLTIFGFNNVNVFPGSRCKSDWFYTNRFRFFISAHIPFREKRWFLPSVLTGRATSVIAICCKPFVKAHPTNFNHKKDPHQKSL